MKYIKNFEELSDGETIIINTINNIMNKKFLISHNSTTQLEETTGSNAF